MIMLRITKRRALPILVGLSTAFVLVSPAGVDAMPAERTVSSHAAAVAAVPGDTVATNSDAAATAKYWTSARMQRADDLSPTRTDAVDVSYGSANLDFTRSRVSPVNVNATVPYKTTGKVFFTEPGVGDFQCSGSTIAKRLIITAAHCVNSGHGFYTNWVFIPGYDGSKPTLATQRPFGTWTWASAEVPINWINTDAALPNATDFAAIAFNDQSFSGGPLLKLSQRSGKYAVALNHLADTAVTMLGYPCNFDSCNIMQRNDTSDHRIPPGTSGANAYEYGSDMTGGSSGGPWVENFGDPGSAAPSGGYNVRNAVVAVTSYGYLDGGSALVLGASNLDANWTTIYNSRCAAAVGNC
jgi:V8-like Glu-specific endopeptidase